MEAKNTVQMGLFGEDWGSGNREQGTGKSLSPVTSSVLSSAPAPNMVRVAPGRHAWVPKDAATPPDGYALCRWSKQSDGTFAPVPVAGRYVRLNSQVAATLGFVGDDVVVVFESVFNRRRCRSNLAHACRRETALVACLVSSALHVRD